MTTPDPHQPDPLVLLLDGLARLRDGLSESPDLLRQADTLLSGQQHLREMPADVRESYRVAIERFCRLTGLESVLREAGVIHAYDIRQAYPQRPGGPAPKGRQDAATGRNWSLLGHEIGFPIGVPASVLTANVGWIDYFARHGFNVLTFKTVRSRSTDVNPYPNWVFLEDQGEPLPVGVDPDRVCAHGDEDTYLRHLRAFSMANSFGVPSLAPEHWMPEVSRAVEALGDQKLLIVSVMGSSEPGDPSEALCDDFVRVAEQALAAGAPAIELNLSCPNTLSSTDGEPGVKPPLCMSVADTLQVVKSVHAVTSGHVPLVAKLSYLPEPELRPLVKALNPYVDAFSGINTLQVWVETSRGKPTFGTRRKAGLSGIAIRHLAADFVRSLKRLRDRDSTLDYQIIAMGGVMDSADVYALLALGADAVQSATAASVNPRLARETFGALHQDPECDAGLVERVRTTLYDEGGRLRTPSELAELLDMDRDAVERNLNPLGELDLPRRVVELLAIGLPAETASAASKDDLWGPAPSSERMREVDRVTKQMVDKQNAHLANRSATVEEVAARLHWEQSQVEQALEDGPLVYYEWAGRVLLPLWQLVEGEDGDRLLPGLQELKQAFARDVPALDAWLLTANPSLGGRTPLEALIAGESERVLRSITAIGAGL